MVHRVLAIAFAADGFSGIGPVRDRPQREQAAAEASGPIGSRRNSPNLAQRKQSSPGPTCSGLRPIVQWH